MQSVEPSSSSSSSAVQAVSKHTALQISYRGQNHDIEWPNDGTLGELQARIAELTNVDATHQKLLGSGSLRGSLANVKEKGDVAFIDAVGDLRAKEVRVKIMVVGPKSEELNEIQRVDAEAEKRNRPRQYHPSMLRGTKARTTASSTRSPFHSLQVHPMSKPSSAEYDSIMTRLRKLSTDPATLHVCQIHNFEVGVLTELLPHEHPNLLGLNENMGQRISIRLRTDKYDGLIHYRDVRKVLLHELAHNKINDHPVEFKILNSELNAQVEAYERKVKEGTHRLSEMDVYVPPEETGAQDSVQETVHVLGGSSSSTGGVAGSEPLDDNNLQAKRQRVLMATMKRLEKSEAEIEKGCGSAA